MNHELFAYLSDRDRLWALDEHVFASYLKAAEAYSGPQLEARAPGSSMRADGNVAVIGVAGPIDYRPSIFTALFGGAAITSLRSDFRAALADPGVKSILFAFDSPGGAVSGVTEFANEIMAARGSKPIVAQIDPMAASAASWLASAADQVIMTPSGVTAALGVLAPTHLDMSGAMEKEGVKATVISAGEFKGEANPFGPLSAGAKAAIQARADAMYAQMMKDVAAGRKVTQTSAREDFGKGRVMNAADALKAGLIDEIGTMDQTIAKLTGRKSGGGMRAEDEARGRMLL